MGIKGKYLNIIKATYDKLSANIILSGEELKAFSSNISSKTRMSILTTLFNIVLEILVL